jgi:excisionase family DNA binding protein
MFANILEYRGQRVKLKAHWGNLGKEAMKHRSTQFGVRKNPDSQRVHGSRISVKEFVEVVPVKPARSTRDSGGGREMHHLRNDNRFEPLLDVVEAATLLRMHPRTLRVKARKRIIPAIQVGRRWRFRASTLNVWLENLPS